MKKNIAICIILIIIEVALISLSAATYVFYDEWFPAPEIEEDTPNTFLFTKYIVTKSGADIEESVMIERDAVFSEDEDIPGITINPDGSMTGKYTGRSGKIYSYSATAGDVTETAKLCIYTYETGYKAFEAEDGGDYSAYEKTSEYAGANKYLYGIPAESELVFEYTFTCTESFTRDVEILICANVQNEVSQRVNVEFGLKEVGQFPDFWYYGENIFMPAVVTISDCYFKEGENTLTISFPSLPEGFNPDKFILLF